MRIFSYTMSFIIMSQNIILISNALNSLLPTRYKIRAHFFIAIAGQLSVFLGFYLLDYYTKSNLMITPFVAPLIPFIFAFFGFKESVTVRLAAYTLVLNGFMFADIVPLVIFMCLSSIFPDVTWLPSGLDNPLRAETIVPAKIIITTVITSCLNIIPFSFLTKLLKHRFITYRPAGTLKIGIALIMCLFTYNLFGDFVSFRPSPLRRYMLPGSLVFWTLSIFCLYVLVRSFRVLECSELLRLKKINKIKNDQLLSQCTRSIETEFLASRKWNHDINNHLSAITRLIECGDKETALHYIDLLLEKGIENQ